MCYNGAISTGQPGFMDELDDSKIHRVANILTLEQYLHTKFDKLALWLEGEAVKDINVI